MPNPFMRAPLRTSKKAEDRTEAIPPVLEHQYADDNIPYRGIQRHGVPKQYEPVEPPDYEHDAEVEYEPDEPELDPVAVRIVSSGSRELRKWRVVREYVRAAEPRMILGRDENRSRATIFNLSSVDTLWINHESFNNESFSGFPILPNSKQEIFAEDPVYAMQKVGAALDIVVSILVEYTIAQE